MFTTLIVQPLFNLLVLIYAILPGHNFGLSLIIFTIIIRLAMWPLVKKQLHQATAMRRLQPEIKKIKVATKGNRAKEQAMLMELYKERGINPVGTIPILILNLIIFIGLYSGIRRVITNPHELVSFAYPSLQHLGWIEQLSHNIHLFDNTLFGIVDLSRAAIGSAGGLYIPALLLVLGSAVAQYFQSVQLMPQSDDKRGLRAILRDASSGKQADQSEVSAAVSRSTRYLLPVIIFVATVRVASALSLYWFVGGLVAYIQQSILLRRDETEMEAIADAPDAPAKKTTYGKFNKNVTAIPEAQVVAEAPVTKQTKATGKGTQVSQAQKRKPGKPGKQSKKGKRR